MAETSIFEVARQSHEEIERYIQAATDLVASNGASSSSTSSSSLKRNLQVSKMLDQIVSRNYSLYNVYLDAAGDVKDELNRLNEGSAGTDNLAEFYERLSKIKDYHKKYPNATPDVFTVQLEAAVGHARDEEGSTVDALDGMFSGEEMAGRFVDLYSHHDAFLNLKGVRRITYLQYLDVFDKLQGEDGKVPPEAKRTDAYKVYLRNVQTYLIDFLRKTRPLSDIDALEITTLAQFEEDWEQGRVSGWEAKGEELLGSAVRSSEVQANGEGVWCEACRRTFAKQTVFDGHLKGQKHIKAAERLQTSSNGSNEQQQALQAEAGGQSSELEKAKRQARAKAIARDETIIISLGKELLEVRAETRANVERRSALTDKERQAEAEAAAIEASSADRLNGRKASGERGGDGEDDEDDEDEKIYNPLKLPLGWDGKPIPFWLYKLHGLGVEFKCEICSDFVYQGRKNFERHFQESRHAFGMRALGLPNTKHFYEITRIEDALALAEKLKRQGKVAAEEQEAEEVEDEHGNTYTKKTYELLKRQGLI
ncbi:hypothetical protein CBS101457_004834 [Exobasidium rhododendri]|nr:hypothetical protein CBS101457_004834 [Exobasidium rhododendri]